MNRTKTVLALAVAAAAGFYAAGVVSAFRLMRHADDLERALRETPGLADMGHKMAAWDSETRRRVAKALQEATPEEVMAMQRVLDPENIEEALRSGAYDATDLAKRGKPATPPPFPDKPEDEPPHQYIGAYGPTGPQC